MASNINAQTIDEFYPIAGADNDSQGFRDNFNIIKNSFSIANLEITNLQNHTAKLNEANDFSGTIIQDPTLLQDTYQVYNVGNVSSSLNINWSNGSYQNVTVTENLELTLTEWPPADRLGKLRMAVTADGVEGSGSPAREVTFIAGNGGIFRHNGNFTNPFTVQFNTDIKIFDFWTTNGGNVIYVIYHGEFSS